MTSAATMFDRRAEQLVRHTVAFLGVAAGYYACGFVGTVLSIPPSGFAIIWPATAFLIAALIVGPDRWRWLYLAAVIPAHFLLAALAPGADVPPVVMLSQIAGNLGLAVATVLVLEIAAQGRARFDDFRSVLRFILLAGIVVPAVGNALILCLHLMTGWTGEFWLSWRQWMLASIFPTLTIPPVLALAFARADGKLHVDRKAALELTILYPLLFTASFIAFGWGLGSQWWPELALISLPLMLWVAVRFGVGATSLAMLVFAAAIIARALEGQGPFAVNASPASVLALQVFLTALCMPLMLLSASASERRRTEELLQRSEARIQVVAASTDTGLWQWDQGAGRLWLTDYCRSMFGIPPAAQVTPERFLKIVHLDDRTKLRAALGTVRANGKVDASSEFRVVRADGEAGWFVVHTHTEFDEAGSPLRVSGVFRDITQRIKAQREVEDLSQRLLVLQEEERQRITEELHEATAQNLVAVSLNLEVLKRRVSLSNGASSLMDEAFASLTQAKNDLRTFTYLLRPAGLDREGLCAVLKRHVEGFSRWTALRATFRPSPDTDRLSLEQQRAVLRIAQESLINVHRHAGATRVHVGLRRVGDDMHLVIRDNGEGIKSTARRPAERFTRPGIGIPGMTARIRQLSGRIDFRSNAHGTVVHAAIPMAYAEGVQESADLLTG